jgi:hypothetical protein
MNIPLPRPSTIANIGNEELTKVRSNHNTDQIASEALNSPTPVSNRIEILIVDDNIFNLSTLQTMIKMKFGLESTTVCSGQLAIKSVID